MGHDLAVAVAAVANLAVAAVVAASLLVVAVVAANSVVAVVAVVAVANPAERTLDHSHTLAEHIAQLAHMHLHYHRFLPEIQSYI